MGRVLRLALGKTTRTVLRAGYWSFGLALRTAGTALIERTTGLAEPWPFALYVALLVLVYVMLEALLALALELRAVRRRLYPVAAFEGVWLQRTSLGERPYSVSWIRFERARDGGPRWVYEGWALDRTFGLAARWECRDVQFDEADRRWFFLGPASLGSRDPTTKRYRRARGRGEVIPVLTLPAGRAYDRAEGIVIDVDLAQSDQAFRVELLRADPLFARAERPDAEAVERNLRPEDLRALFARLDLLREGEVVHA